MNIQAERSAPLKGGREARGQLYQAPPPPPKTEAEGHLHVGPYVSACPPESQKLVRKRDKKTGWGWSRVALECLHFLAVREDYLEEVVPETGKEAWGWVGERSIHEAGGKPIQDSPGVFCPLRETPPEAPCQVYTHPAQ